MFPIGVDIKDRDQLTESGDKLKGMKVRVLGDKDVYMNQAGFKKAVAITFLPED